jgi:hypothetical protein
MAVINTANYVTAGTSQYGYRSPIWTGYQTQESFLPVKVYLDNSASYPITKVGTGDFVIDNASGPMVGDKFNTIYSPENTDNDVPLVGTNKSYATITATAANGGIKVPVKLDLSKMNWLVFVDRSDTASVAGKIKVRSSVGNESVISFTTSATAKKWIGGGTAIAHTFQFREESTSNVAFVGTPNFTDITEIEITLDAAGQIDAAMIYFVEDAGQFIGGINQVEFECLSEVAMERNLETSQLMCNQLSEMVIGTSKEMSYTFTVKKQNLQTLGLASGAVTKTMNTNVYDVFTSPEVSPRVITSGTITLANGNVTIDKVSVPVARNNVNLKRFGGAAADTPVGMYHQSGTTLTFNAAYNGLTPTVMIHDKRNILGYEERGLETGPVGYLVVPRQTQSGNLIFEVVPKCQISLDGNNSADDGDETTIKLTVMADKGVFMRRLQE